MNTLGTHLICELSRCDSRIISDVSAVKRALELAADAAGVRTLNGFFHKFSAEGVSGLLCLAESHLSVHTWPESGYVAADIYTCGETAQPGQAAKVLSESFRAGGMQIREIKRGLPTLNNVFTSVDETQPHKSLYIL